MKWRKKWNFGLEIGINPLKQTTTHETEKANKVKQKGQLAYGNDYSQFRNRMITAIDEKSAVYGEIKIGSQWKQNAIVLMSHMKMHSKKCVIITCSVLICQAHTSYRCNCDYTVFFTICRIMFFSLCLRFHVYNFWRGAHNQYRLWTLVKKLLRWLDSSVNNGVIFKFIDMSHFIITSCERGTKIKSIESKIANERGRERKRKWTMI